MSWTMFRRVERQATRMHEMMERLDVDPVVLVRLRRGDVYAEARARCLFCGTSDKCLRWLQQQPPPDKRPEFCPNLSLFEACRRNALHVELSEPRADLTVPSRNWLEYREGRPPANFSVPRQAARSMG